VNVGGAGAKPRGGFSSGQIYFLTLFSALKIQEIAKQCKETTTPLKRAQKKKGLAKVKKEGGKKR